MSLSAIRSIFIGFVLISCLQSLHCSQTSTFTPGLPDYVRAEALIRSHQWNEGLALLLPLLKHQPRNLKALNLAGLAYIGKEDPGQASVYFSRALKVDPSFAPALKNLSINEYNEHRYQLAEKHLLAASRELPDDQIVTFYLGEVYFAQHKYALAADKLARSQAFLSRDSNVVAHLAISYLQTGRKHNAIELLDGLDPAHLTSQSQFALGLALEQFEIPEHAIRYLQAVSQQYPDSYDAGFDLAVSFIMAKDFPQAIRVATALIQRGHETAELDNVLAEAYEGNKDTQKAVDTYRRAISLDPDDDDNYLDFATLCMSHNSMDEGLMVVRAGLQVHPKSERLIFIRGVLYAMQDRFDLAEEDFRRAALLAPQGSLGYVGLGVTYLETGNAKQAVQVLRQRLRQTPDDASLLYLLGEALLKSGGNPGDKDYSEAQVALEKSIRLNPQLCLPHVALGTIYLAENKLPEALTQLEQARRLDPTEKSAYSHLAVAYRRLGQMDNSREALASLKDILDRQREGGREKAKAQPGAVSGNNSAPALQ